MKFKTKFFYSSLLFLIIGVIYKIFLEINVYNYESDLKKFLLSNKYYIPTMNESSHVIEDNKNKIYYYTAGDKLKPALLFLHPAFADHNCFKKQLDYFSKDYHIISIDMLGHGKSKVINSDLKIDATVIHIEKILKLEGHANAHIVGVSMGSLIAQSFASRHPDNILSITIVGGYPIYKKNKEVEKAQGKEMFKWIFKALFSMDAFRKYLASVTVYKEESKFEIYQITKGFTRKSFIIMSGLNNLIKEGPIEKRQYPIMILVGSHDIELSKKQGLEWHKAEPSSFFYEIEDAGHCANMDNSTKFNNILRNFLNSKDNITLGI